METCIFPDKGRQTHRGKVACGFPLLLNTVLTPVRGFFFPPLLRLTLEGHLDAHSPAAALYGPRCAGFKSLYIGSVTVFTLFKHAMCHH